MTHHFHILIKVLLFSTLFLGHKANSQKINESFDFCVGKILDGKSIEDFIKIEESLESPDKVALNQWKSLIQEKNCISLLRHATLKNNGILKNKDRLAASILDQMTSFHRNWIMPKDLERGPRCFDKYSDDIYDYNTPAYHLTRALFQEDREGKSSVTSYGDLRIVKKGDNVETSPLTKLSGKTYQELLGLKGPLSFPSEKEDTIGYLYKLNEEITKIDSLTDSDINNSWETQRQSGRYKLINHLGGGLLGSPAFLLYFAPKGALEDHPFKTDGALKLHRNLAKAIYENILCEDLTKKDFSRVHSIKESDLFNKSNKWHHPITQEEKCLKCHAYLDPLAATYRNVTYLQSQGECGENTAKVLIPHAFKTSNAMELWSSEKEQVFSFSYPHGLLDEKKISGINQLGRTISEDIRFYRCQISKYAEFFLEKNVLKEIKPDALEKLALEYKKHQNGLRAIEQLLKL